MFKLKINIKSLIQSLELIVEFIDIYINMGVKIVLVYDISY